jgi:hypothetical protein
MGHGYQDVHQLSDRPFFGEGPSLGRGQLLGFEDDARCVRLSATAGIIGKTHPGRARPPAISASARLSRSVFRARSRGGEIGGSGGDSTVPADTVAAVEQQVIETCASRRMFYQPGDVPPQRDHILRNPAIGGGQAKSRA